jgi:hypothetical protein
LSTRNQNAGGTLGRRRASARLARRGHPASLAGEGKGRGRGAGAVSGLACLLLLAAAGCKPATKTSAAAAPSAAGDAAVVVLFAGNNDGVLAACGCPGNPSGGFAKRQGLIEQYRRARPHVLVVDAGNLFPERKHATKVEYLAKAAGRAGYDALALGVAEFLLGADRLRELHARYDLPFLCANVRDASGDLVVPPHVIREKAGLRIGIFAVIGDWTYGFPRLEWRKGLQVEDPLAAARREAEALASCDLVIAVSHQPIAETRRLAAQVEGLDVVIVGHEPTVVKKPEKVGGAVLVGAVDWGNFLGALTLRRAPDGARPAACDVTFLSARVPGAKWVEDLYWQYVREAKEKPPPTWDTPVPAVYEPSKACAKCHKAEYAQWKTTGHARSYEPILEAGRQDDPECLMCHTMGFGRPGGFVSMNRTPGLGRATCQACHVVTSDHKKKGVKPEPKINISSRLCMSCHGPIQSPDFDYYVYKPKILHRPSAGAAPPGEAPGH